MRVVAVNGKTGTVTDQRDTMGLIVQMDDGTTERMNGFTGWHLQSDVLPYLQGQAPAPAPAAAPAAPAAPATPATPATASPAQQVTRTGRPIDPNLTNSVGAMQGLAAGPDGLRLEDGFA
jgi:pyruvate/2-oxoglutarate dehydrogenase complex dihydrolipoamide acyltransferase (E2) component